MKYLIFNLFCTFPLYKGEQSYELCRKLVRQENVKVDIDKEVILQNIIMLG